MTRKKLSQQMQALVAQYYESGLTQAAFAEQHAISKEKLKYRIGKFTKAQNFNSQPSDFVALTVTANTPTAQVIYIRLANGTEIQIPF